MHCTHCTHTHQHHLDSCFTIQNTSKESTKTLSTENSESASRSSGMSIVTQPLPWQMPGELKVPSTSPTNRLTETVNSLYDNESSLLDDENLDVVADLYDHNDIRTNVPTPKGVFFNQNLNLRPVSFVTVETIQGQKCRLPFKCLFDPGSDSSFITAKAIPLKAKWERVKTTSVRVMGGVQTAIHQVFLKNIALSEFSRSIRTSQSFRCYVNPDNDCPYDIILGLDSLTPVGIDVICSEQKTKWPSQTKKYHFDLVIHSIHQSKCFKPCLPQSIQI
jgi:Retroviral aspartyl protease